MKVSFITPVYKVEKYIERCVESLLNQTLDEVEFIFINDCSPDSSMQILEGIVAKYPYRSVKIINNSRNLNVSASREIGLAAATGEYIAWCDSDDWMELDALEAMYCKAKESNCDIVWSDFFWNESGYIRQQFEENRETCIKQMCTTTMYWTFWNKLFRRSLFTDNKITIENFQVGGDLFANLRLFYVAKSVAYLPQATYHYNKFNNEALTSNLMYSPIKVAATVEVITEIARFYSEKPDYSLYKESITELKLWFKDDYLHAIFEQKTLLQWRKIFPECHKYIWKKTGSGLLQKLIFWFATCHLTGFIAIWKNIFVLKYHANQ